MNRLIQKVNKAYDAYVQKENREPKYAVCKVLFTEDTSPYTVAVKLNNTVDKEDDKIFYYCSNITDFTHLMVEGEEDFTVTELIEFTDTI